MPRRDRCPTDGVTPRRLSPMTLRALGAARRRAIVCDSGRWVWEDQRVIGVQDQAGLRRAMLWRSTARAAYARHGGGGVLTALTGRAIPSAQPGKPTAHLAPPRLPTKLCEPQREHAPWHARTYPYHQSISPPISSIASPISHPPTRTRIAATGSCLELPSSISGLASGSALALTQRAPGDCPVPPCRPPAATPVHRTERVRRHTW